MTFRDYDNRRWHNLHALRTVRAQVRNGVAGAEKERKIIQRSMASDRKKERTT